MKRKFWMILLCMSLFLTACGGGETVSQSESSRVESESHTEESESENDSEMSQEESAEESMEDGLPEGYVYSVYTGLPISEEVANNRPVAISINNIKAARPQSGLFGADIVYEVETEGGIPRFLAIFQDYEKLEKIGSIRSARRSFLDFALDQQAVLIHYGQDKAIIDTFDQIGCVHMNGLSGLGTTLTWRSSDRVAPHNVYTSGERIVNALKQMKLDTEIDEVKDPMFQFEEEWAVPVSGKGVSKITIPFFKSSYVYDADQQVYHRYQDNQLLKDQESNQEITFTNLIIQMASIGQRAEGDVHVDVETIGSGKGYYMSGGMMQEVTWKKTSQQATTHWYDLSGNEIVMNPGTTWITVLRSTEKVVFE